MKYHYEECPDENILSAYIDKVLNEDDTQNVIKHFIQCQKCRQKSVEITEAIMKVEREGVRKRPDNLTGTIQASGKVVNLRDYIKSRIHKVPLYFSRVPEMAMAAGFILFVFSGYFIYNNLSMNKPYSFISGHRMDFKTIAKNVDPEMFLKVMGKQPADVQPGFALQNDSPAKETRKDYPLVLYTIGKNLGTCSLSGGIIINGLDRKDNEMVNEWRKFSQNFFNELQRNLYTMGAPVTVLDKAYALKKIALSEINPQLLEKKLNNNSDYIEEYIQSESGKPFIYYVLGIRWISLNFYANLVQDEQVQKNGIIETLKDFEYIYNELRIADANEYLQDAVRDLVDHGKEVEAGEALDVSLINENLRKIEDFFRI